MKAQKLINYLYELSKIQGDKDVVFVSNHHIFNANSILFDGEKYIIPIYREEEIE